MKADLNVGINSVVEDWRKKTTADLKREGARHSTHQFYIRSKNKVNAFGEIEYVGLKVDKAGVFFEKGVGRGRGIGTGKENPTPWFNPIIEKQMPLLADDLGLEISNLLARALIK